MFNLVPRHFFSQPNFPSAWEDEDFWSASSQPSGLSVSEDQSNVYVEAAVPGIDPQKVEITFDKGVLWIKGNQEHEEASENKKYYKKASSSFSYHVTVPGEIDQTVEPEAVCKNGIMKVTFKKVPQTQPKKISVKVQ
jgi:HSP20 family protein